MSSNWAFPLIVTIISCLLLEPYFIFLELIIFYCFSFIIKVLTDFTYTRLGKKQGAVSSKLVKYGDVEGCQKRSKLICKI